MNEKQLTKGEIQQLFQFMEEHGVKSYDIQLELVDHFASELEREWNNYPQDYSFDKKVLVIYEQLRPIGFKNIIRQKDIAFGKWFRQYCYQYIKSFFTWPKILFSLLLMFLFYGLLMSQEHPYESGKYIMFIGMLIPFLLFLIASSLKEYYVDKTHISSISYMRIDGFLFPSLVQFLFFLLDIFKFNPNSEVQQIPVVVLSICFPIILYYMVALSQALYHAQKDFKLKYPKLV